MNLIYIILICFVVVNSLLRHMDLEEEKKIESYQRSFHYCTPDWYDRHSSKNSC